jgi:hypothetical protein
MAARLPFHAINTRFAAVCNTLAVAKLLHMLKMGDPHQACVTALC